MKSSNKKQERDYVKSQIENNTNHNLIFKNFIVNSMVNELYSQTEFIIEAQNHSEHHLDINFLLPILPNSVMIKFDAEIGKKILSSKIYSKEKGEEKFVDSVSSGNNAFLSSLKEINSQKYIQLSLGNVEANQSIKLTIHTLEINESEDKSIRLLFSNLKLPKLKNIKLNDEIAIDYNIKINASSQITRLISKSHPNINFNTEFNNNQEAIIKVNNKKHLENKDLVILFRTKELSKPKVYEEKNILTNTYTYSVCQMFDNYDNITINNEVDFDPSINYIEKYDKNQINDFPGNFYFLIDQSGSMQGKSIDIAKEALILFLKSLPENSKYNIIGFGSRFIKYHPDALEYNGDNLNNSINIIKSLGANLGGTIIDKPLSTIYHNNTDNIDKNLPSFIFLLTDGEVSNKENVFKLIEENNNNFTVTSLGIGSNVDFDLIEKSGTLGKGGHKIAIDVFDLKKIVIESLNNCLKPFMSKFKVEVPDKISSNLVCSFMKNDRFVKQDEIFNFSFISNEKVDSSMVLKIIYQDYSLNNSIINEVKLDSMIYSEGDIISKIVVSNFLRRSKIDNEEFTKMALNFQIMSDYTSLFAECISENVIISKISVDIISTKPEIKDVLREESTNIKCKKADSSNNKGYILQPINDSKMKKVGKIAIKSPAIKSQAIKSYDETISQGDECDFDDDNLFNRKDIKKPKKKLKEKEKDKDENINQIKSDYKQLELKDKIDKNYDCINNELFMFIIESQTFDGLWTEIIEDSCKKLIDNCFTDMFQNFKEYIKNMDKDAFNQIDDKVIVSTIFALYLLEKKFTEKYDEFKLIANKTKKILSKKGINNDLIQKLFSFFD